MQTKEIIQLVGGAIVVWGFIDLGMSWAGTDVWWDWLGVDVGGLFPFTHWIAFGVGGVMTYAAGSMEDESQD